MFQLEDEINGLKACFLTVHLWLLFLAWLIWLMKQHGIFSIFLIVYACLQYKSKMLPLLIEELAKGQGAAVSKLSEEIYGIGHYVQIFLIGGFYVQIFCSHI